MAKDYTNSIDDITINLSTWAPSDNKNYSTTYSEITENFIVPAAYEGRHRIELDFAIHKSAEITVEVDGNTLINIRYGIPPEDDEVGINYLEVPLLEFNSSLEGLEGTVTYTPLGSVTTAQKLNEINAVLKAIVEEIL